MLLVKKIIKETSNINSWELEEQGEERDRKATDKPSIYI